jgi:predicted DNA-binding antitoxin AbrB/MazE fold protein
MSHEVDAVYNNGAFVPVTPMAIREGTHVHLRVEEKASASGPSKLMSQTEFKEFLQRMADLPLEGPDDGFSGADHDKVLYGEP